ncbi:MAG: efflux RND transporter periplasmic adaptor subunit [Cyclobacteriaceae bacterium]|nr:efflux RND transporter periplasmic adaptor subunit [Cyclobacteriaceae bacterium]
MMLIVIVIACTTNESAHNHADTYTCPMHPTVLSDRPGSCPVCGMDLVRKSKQGEEVKITEDLAKLIKSPNERVTASIKTVKAEYRSSTLSKELLGIVAYDTRNIYMIPAKIGGRLEKVYLKYNYQRVTKGMKIAEVYSPELINAQRELVYLRQNDSENKSMIEAATRKLTLLGATEDQIKKLEKSKEVLNTFSIYSPYDGYLILNSEAPQAPLNTSLAPGSTEGMGMNEGFKQSAKSNPISAESSLLREGDYVSNGQTLFRVVNANSIWIEFNIPAEEAFNLTKNDTIELLINGKKNKAKIDFVEPFTEQTQDFIQIRSYYKGDNLLIGQLVNGTVLAITKETLWLPKTAVMDLGINQVVFIKERGQFKAKQVETGIRADEFTEIIKGLTSGDEVASNAQYLVDSEGFIKIHN